MLLETEVKPEIASMVSSTEIPVMITLNSKPYTTMPKVCRLCRDLPLHSLIELTLDLLFEHRTPDDIRKIYNPFLLREKDVPISDYFINKHLEHSSLDYLDKSDRKQLQINQRQLQLTEKVLEKMNGDFRLDTAQVDMIKRTIQSLTTFENIFASQKAELDELESGKLPDIMKDTHQSTDNDGKVTTDALYPLTEKKRRQVMETQKKINDITLRLAEVIQSVTKGSGTQTIAIAVDEIWVHLKAVRLAMSNYGEMGVKILREFDPDNKSLHARWYSETGRYFQEKMLKPMMEIQSILRALITDKQ